DFDKNVTFRNILGFDRTTTVITTDVSGTSSPLLDSIYLPQKVVTRQYTEEAQLLGKSFNDHLDWIVGGFYLHSYSPPSLQTSYIFALGDGIVRRSSKSKALFGQGTYDLSALTPGLSV